MTPLQPLINQGNRVFAAALGQAMTRIAGLPTAQANADLQPLWQARDRAVAGLTSRFVTHPWPVEFLFIVSPLVTWIWLGALIIISGGLIALWPVPVLARRRSEALAGARRSGSPVPAREAV